MHLQRQQRRFDYNISPIASDQLPSFATKQISLFKKPQDRSLNSTSPIKGRTNLNASFDNRYKNSLPYTVSNNYSNYVSTKAQQSKEIRDRIIPSNAHRSQQEGRDTGNKISNVGLNEDKKNYQGMRPYYKEDKSRSYCDENRQTTANNNRSLANPNHLPNETLGFQTMNFSGPLQENVNFANNKAQQPRRHRKNEIQEQGIKQVSERELVQKISRINRLNQQINNRLQRMLQKIDNYD